jgi:ABC-type multidrug transport system ATPase subunit
MDVAKSPAIGYCPQFDALPMELTGREVLTLLARLNGFANVKQRVDQILWCLQMVDQADKKVMHYR